MMQDSTPMPPENRDVEAMVAALFTLVAKLDRARHERRAAKEARLSPSRRTRLRTYRWYALVTPDGTSNARTRSETDANTPS